MVSTDTVINNSNNLENEKKLFLAEPFTDNEIVIINNLIGKIDEQLLKRVSTIYLGINIKQELREELKNLSFQEKYKFSSWKEEKYSVFIIKSYLKNGWSIRSDSYTQNVLNFQIINNNLSETHKKIIDINQYNLEYKYEYVMILKGKKNLFTILLDFFKDK